MVDEAIIRVLHANGTVLFELNNGTTLGNFNATWTAPEATSELTVQLLARMGSENTAYNLTGNTTSIWNGAHNWSGDHLYAQLYNTGSYHVYRYTYTGSCEDRVTFRAQYGSKVQLYVADMDPSVAGTDPTVNYVSAEPNANDVEESHWYGPADGQVFSVLVQSVKPDVDYRLYADVGCSGGGEPNDPIYPDRDDWTLENV